MPGEVPVCKNKLKENMLCQVCLVKCRFAKNKLNENMLCQADQINAILQERTCLSSRPSELSLCKSKLKENMLCQVCLVKCRFAR